MTVTTIDIESQMSEIPPFPDNDIGAEQAVLGRYMERGFTAIHNNQILGLLKDKEHDKNINRICKHMEAFDIRVTANTQDREARVAVAKGRVRVLKKVGVLIGILVGIVGVIVILIPLIT